MQRCRFPARTIQAPAELGAAPALARVSQVTPDTAKLHLQNCRIAGSQHDDCNATRARLGCGDAQHLRYQLGHLHDSPAIEVIWRRQKFGYLPHVDNTDATSLLGRAHVVRVEALAVDDPDEKWEPVRLRVWANVAKRI